jgi:hypothetical protein
VCYAAPIWIPFQAFEIELTVRAAAARAGEGVEDIILYPVIDGPEERPDLDTSIKITVSGTTETLYRATIPVPQSAVWAGLGFLHIYYITPLIDTASKGATVISDVTRGPPATIDANLGSTAFIGEFAVFSDATMLPMRFADIDILAGDDRAIFASAWPGPVPLPGTTTFQIFPANELTIYTICAYPLEVTDWFAERAIE